MINNKKGIQLNQAFGAVLVVVLIAVLVIIGIVLFVQLKDNTFTSIEAISTSNETFGPVNETGTATGNATLCNFDNFAVVTATNYTSGDVITSDNYTVDSSAGTVTFTGAGNNIQGYNNSAWNITSTSDWGAAPCDATNEMISQFATYPALIGLIGTIIFLGLVIGVLVASFVFGGRGRKV